MRREFGPNDAKRFYDRFGAKQDAQFYENAPLKRLIARSDFEHASAVFEWGCGTGRLAARLFDEHLGEGARYIGIDISGTMIEIAKPRLARWRDRATVHQMDGASRLPYGEESFDRFVATYVLDLLPAAAMGDVLGEAHRLLTRDGKLCVVALTEGVDPLSRLLSLAWKRVYAFNPRLVGGCRPLHITTFLDADAWDVEYNEVVSSWGICSEIVVAQPA